LLKKYIRTSQVANAIHVYGKLDSSGNFWTREILSK
jgi:hypothetical protein